MRRWGLCMRVGLRGHAMLRMLEGAVPLEEHMLNQVQRSRKHHCRNYLRHTRRRHRMDPHECEQEVRRSSPRRSSMRCTALFRVDCSQTLDVLCGLQVRKPRRRHLVRLLRPFGQAIAPRLPLPLAVPYLALPLALLPQCSVWLQVLADNGDSLQVLESPHE